MSEKKRKKIDSADVEAIVRFVAPFVITALVVATYYIFLGAPSYETITVTSMERQDNGMRCTGALFSLLSRSCVPQYKYLVNGEVATGTAFSQVEVGKTYVCETKTHGEWFKWIKCEEAENEQ